MQDFWVLLRMDSISWRKTLEISHNLRQWPVVNTLFKKEKHHNRKAGSKEAPKLGPFWKLQPVICTVNLELRSELCLWAETTLTPGSEFLMDQKKFVMNLNNNETQIPEDQLEEYSLKLSANFFACRSKANAKPQRRAPAGSSPRIVPIERRNWIDIEPRKHSLCVRSFEESNSSSSSFTTSASRRRRNGSFLENEGKSSESSPTIHSLVWRSMESMFGSRRRSKKEIPTSLSSTLDWYLEVKIRAEDRQYSSCLLILWTKVTKIQRWLTWMYHVMHNTCTMHGTDIKTQYVGSTSVLLLRKGLKFYQTRSNAIILQETLPAYCIPKVVGMRTGEVLYEKVYMSPRPPPKISLKHEWKRELGSEHAQRIEVGQRSRSFQSNQPTPNPIRERSGRLDSTQDGRKTSRSQEIDVNSFCEEPGSSERTVRPVEANVNPTRSSEDRKDFNVEQTRERTVRPVNTHDVWQTVLKHVLLMTAKRSTL